MGGFEPPKPPLSLRHCRGPHTQPDKLPRPTTASEIPTGSIKLVRPINNSLDQARRIETPKLLLWIYI